jgi:glycerate kinase
LDRQSTFGKTVAGVAGLAEEVGTPCLAVGGSVEAPDVVRTIPGLVDLEAAAPPHLSLAEAMASAGPLVSAATERLLRRFLAARV